MAKAKAKKSAPQRKQKKADNGGCPPKPKKPKKEEVKGHEIPASEVGLHDCVGSTENGACLREHGECYGYKKISCCYRWQAHEIAKSRDPAIFNDRSNALVQSSGQIPTSAYRDSNRRIYPPVARYSMFISYPEFKDDWALEGPKRTGKPMVRGKKVVKNGDNFKGDTAPYWNNAHHLIPKGLFWTGVIGGFEASPVANVYDLVRQKLLEVKYNIHYKENMLFLPQDEAVARSLRVPRHLTLGDNTKFDHPVYNDKVKVRLKLVINEYKKVCDKPSQDAHKTVKAKLTKEKLIKLSKDCYKEIMLFGRYNAGKPIDQIKTIRTHN